MIRPVIIQRPDNRRDWHGRVLIAPDGTTHDNATVIKFTPLETDFPAFRCVVRAVR